MTLRYFIGQLCGVIAWIILLISYHAKRENRVIFYQIIASILYIANYFCLGAMTGFYISLFELIKSIGYYKTDNDKNIFYYTLPIYLVIIFITGFSPITIIAILGSLIDGYVLLKDKKTIVIGGTISYIMWIIYDIYFLDFAGAISDLFIVISNLSIIAKGYINYINRANIHTIKSKYVSKNIIDIIEDLDKEKFDKKYRWDNETIQKLTQEKEYSYILLKDKNKIIGYINFLNIKKNIYDKMIKSNIIYDSFEETDISSFQKNKDIYLNLNAIVVKEEYENADTLKKIIKSINKYLEDMKNNDYCIKKICCFAVNHFEVRVLKDLDFIKLKDINNECFLYTKDL